MNHGDARRTAHRGLKLWSRPAHGSSRFSLKHPPRYLPVRQTMTGLIYHSGDSFMLPQASPHTPAMLVLSNLAFLLNSCPLSCSVLKHPGHGLVRDHHHHTHLFDENAWITRLEVTFLCMLKCPLENKILRKHKLALQKVQTERVYSEL